METDFFNTKKLFWKTITKNTKYKNYLTYKEFVDKYGLKDEATTYIKIQQRLNTNQRFAPALHTTARIVNLHPTKEHPGFCIQLYITLIQIAALLQ